MTGSPCGVISVLVRRIRIGVEDMFLLVRFFVAHRSGDFVVQECIIVTVFMFQLVYPGARRSVRRIGIVSGYIDEIDSIDGNALRSEG